MTAPFPALDRFGRIINDLCQSLGGRYPLAVGWPPPPPGPVLILISIWLRRSAARVNRWAARMEAWPSRASTRSRAPAPAAVRVAPTAPVRLPRARGWLQRLVPCAAPSGGQLQHLLGDPEMQALIQAAPPSVVRVLRSLGWALAVDPRLLPPPVARVARLAPTAPAPVTDGAAAASATEPPPPSLLLGSPRSPAQANNGRKAVSIRAYLVGRRSRPPPPVGDAKRN